MTGKFKPDSLEYLMEKLDMNQTDFSKYIGASNQSVNNWLRRENVSPSGYYIDKFHRICKHHGFETPRFYEQPASDEITYFP